MSPTYMGLVFEGICKEYLIRKNRLMELPFMFNEIGGWWGNNPITKMQDEIDIIAKDDENIIIGECKWNNKPVGLDVLEKLYERTNIFNIKNKYLFIFSKSGFTKGLINKKSDNSMIYLISFEDMVDEIKN